MLGEEPTPTQTVPPPSFFGANMELAMVSINQTEVVPPMAGGIPAFEGSLDVPILRIVVNSKQSSPTKEVIESLKWKNSQLAQDSSAVPVETTSKKRRLVKESRIGPLNG